MCPMNNSATKTVPTVPDAVAEREAFDAETRRIGNLPNYRGQDAEIEARRKTRRSLQERVFEAERVAFEEEDAKLAHMLEDALAAELRAAEPLQSERREYELAAAKYQASLA